jgi:hypothetical protein
MSCGSGHNFLDDCKSPNLPSYCIKGEKLTKAQRQDFHHGDGKVVQLVDRHGSWPQELGDPHPETRGALSSQYNYGELRYYCLSGA